MNITHEIESRQQDNATDILNVVEEYMKEQPYSAECSTCGNALDCTVSIDQDLDMILTVDPCTTCTPDTEA